MNLNKCLLDNITGLIRLHGMTESRCLSECHIHRNFLSNLRSGMLIHPSFDNIYAIAKFFNVPIDSLTTENQYIGTPLSKTSIISLKELTTITDAYFNLDERGRELIINIMQRETHRINESQRA